METKKLYFPPRTDSIPVRLEVNIMSEKVEEGAGTPGFTKDDYTPVWG